MPLLSRFNLAGLKCGHCFLNQPTGRAWVADADTGARVQATLLADQNMYAWHIDVEVDRGMVHLGWICLAKRRLSKSPARGGCGPTRKERGYRYGAHAQWGRSSR